MHVITGTGTPLDSAKVADAAIGSSVEGRVAALSDTAKNDCTPHLFSARAINDLQLDHTRRRAAGPRNPRMASICCCYK